jgi:putative transposase
LLGYCLMSNHVHLVVVPHEADSLATALKQTHGRYASYWNGAHKSSGHVWQGRFYSCPLDSAHLWIALRYTERNPVCAKLVAEAAWWPWSSAAVHCAEQQACVVRHGDVEQALVRADLARVSRQRRIAERDRGDAAVYT